MPRSGSTGSGRWVIKHGQCMEAQFYSVEDGKDVKCLLCPHLCVLRPGQSGICRVRTNVGGKLVSDNYGLLCSLHSDPIEKKPLYHYFPGSRILSAGTVGCNLRCRFCQNYEISQTAVKDYPHLHPYTPQEIVALAIADNGNTGIAYTYNEPTVWYEFVKDVALPAANAGLKNVMVTNGYINPEPLRELIPLINAFSVDLKAFTENFYKRLTSSRLAPVLETLSIIRKSGRHLEITNLLIPDENDNEHDFREMMKWIQGELGPETILHLSRFFPTYKLIHNATPEALLLKFYDIACEYLSFVYTGNTRSDAGRSTCCPECGELLISRQGYISTVLMLNGKPECPACGRKVPVVLEDE